MITSHGDRTKALRRMMEALGGSLESMYWQFGTEDSVAVGELPDSVSASALHAAVIKTGAFMRVGNAGAADPRPAPAMPGAGQRYGGGLRGARPAGLSVAEAPGTCESSCHTSGGGPVWYRPRHEARR